MRGRTTTAACLAAAAVLLPALPAAAGRGEPPAANGNGSTVELSCAGETVDIWVNAVASERSGESPALVVAGASARVFKTVSYGFGGATYPLRFPAPSPPFTLVECTHAFGTDTVTLEGVFIP